MKKYFGWILVIGLSIFVLTIANQALSRQTDRETDEKFVAPSPPGPSAWCTQHSEACPPKDQRCHSVKNSLEACADARGNGDGFVCSWEMKLFKDECKESK